MQTVTLYGVNRANVARVVGADTFVRGVEYARQHSVIQMRWDQSDQALDGMVRGSAGNSYDTTAYFSSEDGSALALSHGECSCPVGFNCKHVAALVLSAMGDTPVPNAPVPNAPSPKPRPSTWERSLGSLLEPTSADPVSRRGGTALAVELTLGAVSRSDALSQGPRVLARLVRPGKNGWAGGGLSWNKLAYLSEYGEYPAAQLRLLRELYAVYRSNETHTSHYSYNEERTIDLSAFDSHQLWPMLDQAEAVGVRLVHSRARLGPLARYGHAELCLDVTAGEPSGALLITPVIRVGETLADTVPVRFIGAGGHGLVHVDRAQVQAVPSGEWQLRLAKLAKPAPPQLQRMALENRSLDIPPAERSRFSDEYYPRLRRLAEVISSDGAFTPPVISEPTLVLRADYGADHALDLRWEWAYQVGESLRRTPLAASEAGHRDPNAELAVLNNLDIPLDRFGLRGTGPDQAMAPTTAFTGIDTMRFSTELLPLLADTPGVAVEVTGAPVEYREASDSLRIGVSTDDLVGETDWFDLGVSITVADRQVPFADVLLALGTDQTHMLLADGTYFSLHKPELQTLRRLIEEARSLQDSPTDPLRISRFQAGLWSELAELGVVNRQAQAWRQQVQGLLSMDSVDPLEPPSELRALLRPYQLDGFRWLAFLWKYQLGGILADDMGLGKTVQSLALLCHARQLDPAGSPFLIVAPTSVVSNWASEAARFAPGLNVVSVSDTLRKRGQALDEVIAGADVVVTSYTLFRLDFDDYCETPWSGLILDEAQFTKNHQSKIYQCTRRFTAPFKLAITGTPMENNLMELWSLLSITAPGLFPNPTRFRDYYARPIERQGDTELLGQLRRRVRPLIKRRTKEQVAADLPAKQEQVLEVELHPRHRKIYETHLQRERQRVLGLIDDMNKNRFTILRSLTLLRRLSLHAGLVDDAYHDLPCGKIDALMEQLDDVVAGGHRALVFSQFTGFLGLVRQRLDESGVPYCYLDGSTRNRAAVVRRFKEGTAPVFLISLKAGGFGLNLTEADYCFLLDPWWNPATEAQAVDRTHRIGQTRNVMVYRLIAKDTIEQKVMDLKARKAELFTNVMDEGNIFGASLDQDDIRGLFA
jgi:SNF2-related domain/Helicase conserved C-terminal domain/SWIM zinc finger